MRRVACVVALALLLLAPRLGAAEEGMDDGGATPRRGTLAVSLSETPDTVQLHIRADPDIEPGSVEVRFAGRKAVVLARQRAGRPIRSRALRLPELVSEEGPRADYEVDGSLVVTLRKQAVTSTPPAVGGRLTAVH